MSIIGAKSEMVSTHSRPKAAGFLLPEKDITYGFNTQPPEGG